MAYSRDLVEARALNPPSVSPTTPSPACQRWNYTPEPSAWGSHSNLPSELNLGLGNTNLGSTMTLSTSVASLVSGSNEDWKSTKSFTKVNGEYTCHPSLEEHLRNGTIFPYQGAKQGEVNAAEKRCVYGTYKRLSSKELDVVIDYLEKKLHVASESDMDSNGNLEDIFLHNRGSLELLMSDTEMKQRMSFLLDMYQNMFITETG